MLCTQISNDLSQKIKYHCPVVQGGNIVKIENVVSQVMIDIEDSYVRWSDEVFCKENGPAECPCVEV